MRTTKQPPRARHAGEPSAVARQHRRAPPGLVLALALLAIQAVVASTQTFFFLETRQLRREIDELMRTAERSTYLVGDVGHLLSRLHANVFEAFLATESELPDIAARCEWIESTLRARMKELPGLLQPGERVVWDTEVVPKLETLRETLATTLRHIADGDRTAADLALDALSQNRRESLDELAAFMEQNQDETHIMFAKADGLLGRNQILELVVAGFQLAAIAGIALGAFRILRRKERELAGYVAQLQQSNSDLDAFAGRLAHDVRNMLAPLRTAGHVLQGATQEPAMVAEMAALIDRVTARASDVLSGLLAFARAGSPALAVPTRIDQEIGATLEELAGVVSQVAADVHVDARAPILVRADPALAHILLLNLLSNALKFMEGRPVRRLDVSARVESGACTLEIADTGPGIATELLPRLFEPFFRVPGGTVGGTGIGLATVKRIADAHGWTIDVRTAPGEGTLVRVTLHDAECADALSTT